MKKLALTTFAAVLTVATSAGADNTANHGPVAVSSTVTTSNTAAAPAPVVHHHHHKHLNRDQADAVTSNGHYREVRVGDPTIVYHEIGTGGAHRGDTIVPFYGEPIRSDRPYEIRYDYNEFAQNDEPAYPTPARHHHRHWE